MNYIKIASLGDEEQIIITSKQKNIEEFEIFFNDNYIMSISRDDQLNFINAIERINDFII